MDRLYSALIDASLGWVPAVVGGIAITFLTWLWHLRVLMGAARKVLDEAENERPDTGVHSLLELANEKLSKTLAGKLTTPARRVEAVKAAKRERDSSRPPAK